MRIQVTETVVFEQGDMFICVKEYAGCNYKPGDFIHLTELNSHAEGLHTLRTSGTVDGRAAHACGGSVWLREKLAAGVFEYIGNVKK
ncbi:hypothetical protein Atoyac14_30 [Aeromonas phage Atoyac14]|nr:hypothetical protein Atoyac14_30 [Aeromonas phage Atoyac14]